MKYTVKWLLFGIH